MKKKRRLKRWVKVTIVLMIILMILSNISKIESKKKVLDSKMYDSFNYQEIIEQNANIEEYASYEEIRSIDVSYTTRMTSYYTDDSYGSSNCTGSGLCIQNFEINENGWYIYQGKLVVATATPYLLNYGFELGEGIHTYRYGNELVLNIDGVDYDAIVTDSCGYCMEHNRIDLFVSNKNSVKDTQIIVKEVK